MKKIIIFLIVIIVSFIAFSCIPDVAPPHDNVVDPENPGKPAVTYTVTFESNGGSYLAPITTESETTISKPVDPTKDGYNLSGWFKESSLTFAWNFASDTVTEDITLYADWTVKTFTMSFDSNGGTSVTPITGIVSGTVPPSPASSTYIYGTFDGWYIDDVTFLSSWDFATGMVTADIILYAKWIFLVLGDTGEGGGTVFYDDTIGYDFDDDSTIQNDERNLFIGSDLAGKRYLEVEDATWSGASDPTTHWGNNNDVTLLINFNSGPIENYMTIVGDGSANTTAIYNHSNAAADYASAGYICFTHSGGGKSDWFLPNAGEFTILEGQMMYVIDFESNGGYWCSSEASALDAHYESFSAGVPTPNQTTKASTFFVRPIRGF